MATLPGNPGVRHLFRKNINIDATNDTCLTCKNQQKYVEGMSNGTLMPCEYSEIIIADDDNAYVQVFHKIYFSSQLFHFQHCLGPEIPSTHVYSLPDNTLVWTMDTNGRLYDRVSSE